jgi:hypothetical protein
MESYQCLDKRKLRKDLPIEQPTRFDFVINLKTEKMLGITVLSSLARACRRVDRVNSECPLLALSGHRFLRRTCPLSGVKRTCWMGWPVTISKIMVSQSAISFCN